MNKKGFTLVELLAIIILLVGVFLLVYPKITEMLEKEEKKIDDMELDTIYDAVDRYVENNNSYNKNPDSEYYILIDTLDNEGMIPIDNSDYTKQAIRVKIGKSSNYHEIISFDSIYKAADNYLTNRQYKKEVGKEYCVSVSSIDSNLVTGKVEKCLNELQLSTIYIKIGRSTNKYRLVTDKIANEMNECIDKPSNNEESNTTPSLTK